LDTDHDADSKDDVVTAEMAVPVNREIHLIMHSKDVGHSFFVPELRVQQDFVPGMDLSVHFTATKIGRYEIVCTQLCGLGHYNMKAYLSVLSPEDFDAWMKKEKAMQ
jgi:cytochrome c oxidase subunit 2